MTNNKELRQNHTTIVVRVFSVKMRVSRGVICVDLARWKWCEAYAQRVVIFSVKMRPRSGSEILRLVRQAHHECAQDDARHRFIVRRQELISLDWFDKLTTSALGTTRGVVLTKILWLQYIRNRNRVAGMRESERENQVGIWGGNGESSFGF